MGIVLCIIGIIFIGIGCFYVAKGNQNVETPKEEQKVKSAIEESDTTLNGQEVKQQAEKSQPEKPKSAEKKGIAGEMRVSQLLTKLSPNEYQSLNDLCLSTGINYTQIDHVVVSVYGIFCIETKNWGGRIIGSASSEQWTQYVGSTTKYYRNPLLQNKAHIGVLQGFLSRDRKAPISSVVVFPSDTDLKISNCNDNEQVITRDELLMVLMANKKSVMTEIQMNQTIKILSDANVVDPNIRKQHVLSVKAKAELDKFGNTEVCPKCGAPLVMKSGKNGNFLGCSAYPECSFTKNIESSR